MASNGIDSSGDVKLGIPAAAAEDGSIDALSLTDSNDEQRDQWSSRVSFLLACLGSALGLGNFWRFPYLVFKYGGGFFFVPYLVSLFTMGIPIMQLEMGIGQVYQCGAIEGFGRLNPRFRSVGLLNSLSSFAINTYFVVIIAWLCVYFVQSFYPDIPFSVYGLSGEATVNVTRDHFQNVILKRPPDGDYSTQVISSNVFGADVFVWVSMLLLLWKGTEFLSKVVYVTVLLPIVMMLALVIIGATRPGAGQGMIQYIGNWDTKYLSDPNMWSEGVGQIFYSISCANGVMAAFASLNPRNSNCVQNGVLVPILNCSFSFLAGCAVFTMVGYFQYETNFTWEYLQGLVSGNKLVFIVYPAALTLVSGGAGVNFLCILFFGAIYFLGIDSAFTYIEANSINVRDLKWFKRFSTVELTAYYCIIGGLISIIYCADIGTYLLDMTNTYLGGVALMICGLLECVCAGWAYKRDKTAERVGELSLLLHEVAYGGGLLLFIVLLLSLAELGGLGAGATFGISFGVACVFLAVLEFGAVVFASHDESIKATLYTLYLYQIDELIDEFNAVILKGKPENWRFRRPWGLIVKFFIPAGLTILLGLAVSSIFINFYGYPDYPTSIQVFGIGSLMGCVAATAICFVFPSLLESSDKEIELSEEMISDEKSFK